VHGSDIAPGRTSFTSTATADLACPRPRKAVPERDSGAERDGRPAANPEPPAPCCRARLLQRLAVGSRLPRV